MDMRIPLIQVDKYLITPFDPGKDLGTDGFPTDDAMYFTVNIQVYDSGTYPTTPVNVYLGDDENAGRIVYWDETKTNRTRDVIDGKPLQTNATGLLELYVGVTTFGYPRYPGCIFKLFTGLAADPVHSGGVGQSLSAFYYTYDQALGVASSNLTPLVLRNFEQGYVLIPEWDKFEYSTSTNLNSLDSNTNSSAPISIAINGHLILRDYTYQDLQTGVDIPYGLMNGGTDNCIVYLVDDGSPQLAPPWRFTTSGTPLFMPDPDKPTPLTGPWWFGAPDTPPHIPNKEPLTLADLYDTDDGTVSFEVDFKYAEGVEPGDTYNIYIYMNGYDPNGQTIRQMLGDGSPLLYFPTSTWDNVIPIEAPPNVKPGDIGSASIPGKYFQGFGQKDTAKRGYLWVDYLVNGQMWSNPWIATNRPTLIDFTGTLSQGSGEGQQRPIILEKKGRSDRNPRSR